MKNLRRLWQDVNYLQLVDRSEQSLAKLLGIVLLVVLVAGTVQLMSVVVVAVLQPDTPWLGSKMNAVLGDLLTLLIAVEVLQNVTSYLRRHVVQIELVLLTAMTAVARKVIVLPPGAENKPQLLGGLGIAVLALAAAFWLVRSVNIRQPPARTGPAIRSPEQDP
ncbi:MAG: phosphate-starvation-inducible PsiE family protein [Prochlorococcaceae cyanobacterium MAG_34]|nr:phosphate-starvation-inducible PsiE family protein [Cyanobium sp. MAG_216]MDP4831414.1 phosphate-starvation-inducible PsiE family protein [Cyanobium sp. MAG_185]MDP4882364.1 phosphate-starvation-inducible PsiE family protein [Cyanobium sp. MAG_137]MDP5117845.1 phosphate-starvation-inducible PsiE family protein [Prochlorococcaceae cyanobacterium MAG_34]